MTELGKLASEAFGSGRLEILRLLKTGPLRYTDLARKSEISEGEVSRHLQRLQSAGLVEKQVTGGFVLTPLARGLLRFDGGLDLLARHAEYFRSHDVHALDERFLLRLEELGYGDFLNDPLVVFESVQEVFRSIRTRFDGICLVAEHAAKAQGDTGPLRTFAESVRTHSPQIRLVLQDEDSELGIRFHNPISPTIEYRTIPVCRVDLCMSDSMAVVAFAQRDGHLDFNTGFFGTDPRFLAWCRDYFAHVWSQGRAVAVSQISMAAAKTGHLWTPRAPIKR